MIPLYRDELEYKLAHSAEELLERLGSVGFVVDPERPDVVDTEDLEEGDADGAWVLDDARAHLEKIREKRLPVDEINAYNHMAIYLRWCMEQDLMSLEFLERYWDTVEEFRADPSGTDLRLFLRDSLGGRLFSSLFDEEGEAFARSYYGEADSPSFLGDIDSYALEYFGPARYHSDAFQDEAYLFLPFDEDYYQAMEQVIGRRFEAWQGQNLA